MRCHFVSVAALHQELYYCFVSSIGRACSGTCENLIHDVSRPSGTVVQGGLGNQLFKDAQLGRARKISRKVGFRAVVAVVINKLQFVLFLRRGSMGL